MAEQDETSLGLTVENLKSDHFVGQAIKDGVTPLYLSLIATEHRLSLPFELAKPFAI